MRKLLSLFGSGLRSTFVAVGAVATMGGLLALADYAVTQGSGTNFGSKVISSVHYAEQLLCDATLGSTCAKVVAGNSAATTDVAVVVADPNVLAAVNQGVATNGATYPSQSIGIGWKDGSGNIQPSAAATPLPTQTYYGTTPLVADPCQSNAATYTPISITTATTTKIVTGTAAKKLYVCYLYLQTAASNNIAVISGTTGGTCGANTAGLIGGTTAANGLNDAANSGQAIGNGGYAVAQVATNNDDICLITSASTPLAGVIKTVVQ